MSSQIRTTISSQYENSVGSGLEWPDYVVIAGYFVLLFSVGYLSSRSVKANSVKGYFMGGRSMNWVVVGTSLFASNIGSGHFIGLAGSGASSGISVAAFELHCIFILMLLGWLFLPTYKASGINTMPEYLRRRLGGQRIRVYLSLLSLMMYIFTKISADLYAGGIFIKQSLGLNMYISVVILLGISALFTIGGGLTTVMWADLFQVCLMLIGALVLTILGLREVGGYTELMENYRERSQPTDPDFVRYKDNCNISEPNNTCLSCSEMTSYYDRLLHPAEATDLPWPGVVFGLFINGFWYWCSDQVIVQRVLSAKNVDHGKAGCLLASCIKLLPLYLLVLPGMIARVLWPNEIGCSNPEKCTEICGSPAGCTNIAYPYLVLRVMPAGATGLMLSVMLAALISSLTSIFNSASTIFSIDIYSRFRKNTGELEQVLVGRLFVIILVGISIVWIPIIEAAQGSRLFDYIQALTSYFGPPVGAVYLLAVFSSRINEKGAFWGLIIGFIIGVIRFVMDFSYQVPTCASGLPDPRPLLLSKVHYLHFSIILFVITCIVTIGISLWTKPIDKKHLHRLTYWTTFSEEIRYDISSDENQNHVVIQEKKAEAISDKSKYFYMMCCMNSKSENNNNMGLDKDVVKLSPQEEAVICANDAKEDPFWNLMNNLGLAIILAISAFIWGVYL